MDDRGISQPDASEQRPSVDLAHSRPIGLHTWSDHPSVIDFTNTVYSIISDGRSSKVRKHLLRVLLLELFLSWQADPDLKLSVPRDNNAYPKSRYNGLGVSRTIMVVVDLLHEAGLIEKANGWWDRFEKRGQISRIWPTDKLVSRFSEVGFSSSDISTHKGQETVILNVPHPRTKRATVEQDYDDSPETRRMRFLLSAYNRLLDRTRIGIPTLDDPFIELGCDRFGNEKRLNISDSDKFVRRIFNRGSLNKGGRFYGGWWQRCPKEWRKLIHIDGSPTQEIDFTGHLPTLLYAGAGIDYWTDINADPYALDGLPASLVGVATRELCKSILVAAINAESVKKAYQGLRGEAGPESPIRSLKFATFEAILSLLRQKHRAIGDRFGTGAGLDMMNTESKITERIISHFTRKEIPVLTIHDSYIVPTKYQYELMEQMRSAFTAVTGIEGVHIQSENDAPTSIPIS